MAASGSLPTVFGLLLVAGGAGLLFFALHTHAERADEAVAQAAASASAAAEAARAAARRAPPSVLPTATASQAPSVATGLAGSAPSGSASAAPSASASADAGTPGDGGAPADGGKADGGEPAAAGPVQAAVFHFTKGGIVLPKEELSRLVALAKELRQKGGGMITIEGYGDEAGALEANALLGRRRATVVRQLFGDIGFDPDRLIIAAPDAGGDASLLGSVRVRAAAVPGAEGKSP